MKKLFIFAIATLGMLACSEGGQNDPEPEKVEGALPGKFSVSVNTKVQFSQGNLQYQSSTNTWRFADHQWVTIASATNDKSTSESGWTDYLNWDTGREYLPKGDPGDGRIFIDWGSYAISNGGNTTNMWRTLTADEWLYLFHGRINAENLFALGTVNDMPGVIILPDNWSKPSDIVFHSSAEKGCTWGHEFDLGDHRKAIGYSVQDLENHFLDNIYTSDEWSKMETAGAVFLPAAGNERNRRAYGVKEGGMYWSATQYIDDEDGESFSMFFYNTFIKTNLKEAALIPQCPDAKDTGGQSVRLVR